ncbi:MAG: type II toxin-antitoxin system RelE/ParE family toxin [Nitrospinae bacterium]|nr:type II toxin-antitoxin system RelE/ParE family toxin [Nitrospinota bacterium]
MKIKILTSASQDLIDGYRFYEKQTEGLGAYFLDTLFSDIDSLAVYGGIHPIYFKKYHRALSKRFPFAIYYRLENDTALVYAILDCRRSPAWIRKREMYD